MNELKNGEILLTIGVAVYNIKEKILRPCLESLVADKGGGVEIILGDDGSDKETGDICREYAEMDSRIRYIRQENEGLSSIRNLAIREARGKVITFVDGDDIVPNGYSECICKALKNAGKEYDIVMFRLKSFIETVPRIKVENMKIVDIPIEAARQFSRACITGEPPRIEDFGIIDGSPSSSCVKIYRRQFLLDNNLFFKVGLKKSEDIMLNARAYFFCKSLGYIPQVLNFYRLNPDSITHKYSYDFEEIIRGCISCDKENMKLFNNDPKILEKWRKYKLIHYAINNFALNIFHKDNPKKTSERKKDFIAFVRNEPFGSFFKSFDFSSYEWHERRLILWLASRERFKTLDIMYRLPISFRVYGKIRNILSKI